MTEQQYNNLMSHIDRRFDSIESLVIAHIKTHSSATRPHRKHAAVSLKNAAKITGLTIGQLRHIESQPSCLRNGYPGRNGDNADFVRSALQFWSVRHQSICRAGKALRKGIENPIHFIH